MVLIKKLYFLDKTSLTPFCAESRFFVQELVFVQSFLNTG